MKSFYTCLIFSALLLLCYLEKKSAVSAHELARAAARSGFVRVPDHSGYLKQDIGLAGTSNARNKRMQMGPAGGTEGNSHRSDAVKSSDTSLYPVWGASF